MEKSACSLWRSDSQQSPGEILVSVLCFWWHWHSWQEMIWTTKHQAQEDPADHSCTGWGQKEDHKAVGPGSGPAWSISEESPPQGLGNVKVVLQVRSTCVDLWAGVPLDAAVQRQFGTCTHSTPFPGEDHHMWWDMGLFMRNKAKLSPASGSKKGWTDLWKQSGQGQPKRLWWLFFFMPAVSSWLTFCQGMRQWTLLITVHSWRSWRTASGTKDQGYGREVWMGRLIMTTFCCRTTQACTLPLRQLPSLVNRILTWLPIHSTPQIYLHVISGCFYLSKSTWEGGILGLWLSSKQKSRGSSKASLKTCSMTASNNWLSDGKSVWLPTGHTLKDVVLRWIWYLKLLTLQLHWTVHKKTMTNSDLGLWTRFARSLWTSHPWTLNISCTYILSCVQKQKK